jgi:lysophospholipase L1-like esterase
MTPKRIQHIDKNGATTPEELEWLPAGDPRFTMRGLAWYGENQGRFCRLPPRAEKCVREAVWSLAGSPAGARLAFCSDTTQLAVRVTNQDTEIMPHMPASGSNGLILYCGAPYRMRPWATAIPDLAEPSFMRPLFEGLDRKMREFRLYLPLYKAMISLELGLSEGASILPPSPPAIEKPIVFYGTSITQGGCASTAGSDYVSSVGRRLNLDVINLGFSGNGKGEAELAELIREINASMYVIDYAGNVEEDELRRTLPGFVRILRQARPETPILFMSSICYAGVDFVQDVRRRVETKRDDIMGFYIEQRRRGDRNIHFTDGYSLLPFGTDSATVDGVHPTDHGFQLMADHLVPVIERILLRDS